MAYRTILLHAADQRRIRRLLEAGVPIARKMQGHLIGFSVIPPYVVVPSLESAGAGATVEEHRDAYRGEMATIKAAFEAGIAQLSPPAEWREADAGFGNATSTLLEHARCADLVVMSQADEAWDSSGLLEDPVRVALESGRPVLMVPNEGAIRLPPQRVTIAWNGRREAARAVFDALPLLAGTQAVNIVWINPSAEQRVAGDVPGAELAATLHRHGITCEVSQATVAGPEVGPEILRQAGVFGSDLLVMGCYGHSRLREFVLGGASRHVLQHLPLPLLMAH